MESLGDADLSRQEGSVHRSFTHAAREQSHSVAGRPIRKITSENGWPDGAYTRPGLEAEVSDLLIDAEEFKIKGDNFYINKKYEQAYKVYEIARDLIQDYYLDNGFDPLGEVSPTTPEGLDVDTRVRELKLQVIMALVESATQLGWYEDAIVCAQEGIATNGSIARLHHLLAKALVGLGDALSNQQAEHHPQQRDYRQENLELAQRSLAKALELSPNDLEIQADFEFVDNAISQPLVHEGENPG